MAGFDRVHVFFEPLLLTGTRPGSECRRELVHRTALLPFNFGNFWQSLLAQGFPSRPLRPLGMRSFLIRTAQVTLALLAFDLCFEAFN